MVNVTPSGTGVIHLRRKPKEEGPLLAVVIEAEEVARKATVSANTVCRNCKQEFDGQKFYWMCPICGTPSVNLLEPIRNPNCDGRGECYCNG